MIRAPATAKLNLALVVGPRQENGRHTLSTVLQRIDLADRIAIAPAPALRVRGYTNDTVVRDALLALAERADVEPAWEAEITKHIPVAGGLGGGSSDAATALRLANSTLERPLPADELHALAAEVGADVPFFLTSGPQVAEGDGTSLEPVELPQDYWVVLVVPAGVHKSSTGAVYEAFDERGGEAGYEARHAELRGALEAITRPRDLAALPTNDLASSPLASELDRLGAFRADVTGAGPAVYGLFTRRDRAVIARREMRRFGRVWLTVPAWYG